jgi:F-type H+-transporting ATPase subunit b
MHDIMTNFGVTWTAFISQGIAFALVLFILQRYAFKPIIAILEERRRRIAEGQENAEKIKVQLTESERKYQEMIDRAQAEAQALINDARTSSDALAQRRQEEANAEASRIVARAHEATEQERDRVLTEVKRELGRLVIETTARVTGKILTPEDRRRLTEETVRQIA